MRISGFWMAVLAATITLAAMDATAKDEVYRWVDDKGVVHFGDRPPEKTAAEAVELRETDSTGVKPPTIPAASADATGEVELSYAEQQRQERAERRRVAAERQAAVEAGCKQRREIVAQLEPSTRVMVKGDDGEVYRLDDNERLKALNEAKTYIAENCRD
jgi:hypothetical protein